MKKGRKLPNLTTESGRLLRMRSNFVTTEHPGFPNAEELLKAMESVYEDFEDRDLASLNAEYQQYTLDGFSLPKKRPTLDFSVCLRNLPGKSCPQDQESI